MNDGPLNPGKASLVLCPDGPILVRGDFDVVTPSGEPVPRQRKTVALCRCGASAIKPYCDGTHKMINFRTETPDTQDCNNTGGVPGTAQPPTGMPPAAT